MKKVICMVLMIVMVVVGSGFTSMRAVDNSALIEELEDGGFVQRGDVWTYEIYDELSSDGYIEWAIAYFDVADNHGIMSYCAHQESDITDKIVCRSIQMEISWDYESQEFIIVSQREVVR